MKDSWILENFGDAWGKSLRHLLKSDYFKKLGAWVASCREKIEVYPSTKDIFRAFRETPIDKVKVVLCGQDPYFTEGYSDGLLLSNSYIISEEKIAPSLKILLEEVNDNYPEWKDSIEYGRLDPLDLSRWARQGVLLINKTCTVPKGYPGAHEGMWRDFSKVVMQVLDRKKDLVFVFLGGSAQECNKYIKNPTHTVINIPHPAAEVYSRGAGFLGSKIFLRINKELELRNKDIVHW